jgi:hypothetical protein
MKLVILLILILYCILNNSTIEHFKWYKRSNCKYRNIKVLQEFLNKYNIKKGDSNDWDIFLPCSYNKIKNEMSYIPNNYENKNIYIINNCDYLTNKALLWIIIRKKYGLSMAIKMMPETYVLKNKNDIKRLIKNHYNNKIYILKKNIQRQKGLYLTNNLKDIINNKKYVVAQNLLQDPYLINGFKINMRFYMLIICNNNYKNCYVYNNGFMYYTKEPFIQNSLRKNPNITTGYIDRSIYKINPLSHTDFKNYLDKSNRYLTNNEKEILVHNKNLSSYFFNKTYKLIKLVFLSSKKYIGNSHYNSIQFQLFGIDIAVNNKLIPQIIEINKGPDLGAKDKKDKLIKQNIINDMFKLLNIINNNNNNFIKL